MAKLPAVAVKHREENEAPSALFSGQRPSVVYLTVLLTMKNKAHSKSLINRLHSSNSGGL